MKKNLRIAEVRAIEGQGAYYYEDFTTLRNHSISEDKRWVTPSSTEGFRFVREIAEVVSLGIYCEETGWSWGDCVGVSYSGKSGREKLFRASDGIAQIKKSVIPFLKNKELTTFRNLMAEIDHLELSLAVKYGLSQSLLQVFAFAHSEQPWQTLQREWGLVEVPQAVPIQGSSGNQREVNAEKMLRNRLAGLPHGQVDDIPNQVGAQGENLLGYVNWLRKQIGDLGDKNYHPVIHLDVHGALGVVFNDDAKKIGEYLKRIEESCYPYPVRIESGLLGSNQTETIFQLKELRAILEQRNIKVQLVADEWANTLSDILEFARSGAVHMVHIKMPDLGGIHHSVEAVLNLKKLGVGSLLGGSCVETDLSARMSVQVALATQPTAILAKPGMGIDEAIQITRNEMNRSLALV